MKPLYFVTVVAVLTVTARGRVVAVKGENGDTSRPAPWYDCSGKQPGNYIHPHDCTRFITCQSNHQAIEFDCGECYSPSCSPKNRLVYNETVDACLWPSETECYDGEEGETTTEDPSYGEDPEPPQEGDQCNADHCINTGYCQNYLRCDKESGTWVKEFCGENLFWDGNNGSTHGGNCNFLENLDEELVMEYRKDRECLACFWEATGECEQVYRYQAPNLNNRNVLTLRCPSGLVFSANKETCQRCNNVQKTDGSTCC